MLFTWQKNTRFSTPAQFQCLHSRTLEPGNEASKIMYHLHVQRRFSSILLSWPREPDWIWRPCSPDPHTHSHLSHPHTLTPSHSLLYGISCSSSDDITRLWRSNPLEAYTRYFLNLRDHELLLRLIEENTESRTTGTSCPSTTMYIGIYVLYYKYG